MTVHTNNPVSGGGWDTDRFLTTQVASGHRVADRNERAIARGKLSRVRCPSVVTTPPPPTVVRFGVFQLDTEAGRLLRNGRVVRLTPQPFRLLQLLVGRAGQVVSREEIREALWGAETFVDFEQGVNSAIKQVREALNEDAERPLYIETVPKRGYRFTAPVEAPVRPPTLRSTDLNLQKALWLNIAELKLGEERRRARRDRIRRLALFAAAVSVALAVLLLFLLR